MEQVLLVDDDIDLVELVAEYLRREGFGVEAVHDGERGVERALCGEHVLVVLDVMLPGIGGFEVLRRVRSAPTPASRVPILMLTARGDEIDRVMGLEWGADDYLAKPHSPRELLARIRATLRRVQLERDAQPQAAPSTYAAAGAQADENSRAAPAPRRAGERLQVGEVEWEGAARVARVRGEALDLTGAEFDLLGLLLRHAGEVVSREVISREVFDRPLLHFDRALDVHISNLRRKLGALHAEEPIKTVRGVGYIFAIASGEA